MNFDFSDEQKQLRTETRRLLEDKVTGDRLRSLIDCGQPWDESLWRALGEMGLLGAAIPEAFGGVGLEVYELCVVAEELGRAVAPTPFGSSITVVAEAIRLFGSEAQKVRWLPRLASGETIATFAVSDAPTVAPDAVATTLDGAGTLHGVKSPVPDLGLSHLLLVSAKAGSDTGLYLVETNQPGVSREPLDGFDLLRHHGRVSFDGAVADPVTGADAAVLRRLEDRSAIFTAFEQIGGAEACLYMARDYALQRPMFGRPLASYQAIKHRLADVLLEIELARSNAYFAAWALATNDDELSAAAAAARISATAAYQMAAEENVQIHGGFGYTWDANCHFHYRRARLLAVNWGATGLWSARLFAAINPASIAAPSASLAA